MQSYWRQGVADIDVCSWIVQSFSTFFPPLGADLGRPRVLLVDDDPDILKALSRFLARDCEVVATVTNGREALDAVPRVDADVVVLDMSMPGLNGLQTAAECRMTRS